jgi:hypothetical protein
VIKNSDQLAALHMAFRYALGRSTYVSSEVVAMIKHAWPKLSNSQRLMFIYEINEALASNQAGMEQDRKEWRSVLELDL